LLKSLSSSNRLERAGMLMFTFELVEGDEVLTRGTLAYFKKHRNCPGWGGSVWVRRIDSIGG
jgi:hypothetical protein